MAGIVAVEFGSKMCPTCQAFWPVWADVQKMLSISTSAVVIDGLQGMNIARRDNTLAHGIPSIYVYDGDTVLSEGWSFDAKSLPRFGSDGLVEAKQQQQLLFPMPEVIAEQVCVAVRKNGFACEVTVNGDGVASNPRLRGTGNALELRSSTHMSLSIGLDEVYVIMIAQLLACFFLYVLFRCLRPRTRMYRCLHQLLQRVRSLVGGGSLQS
eukprot:GEMP01007731.1.p1 GENE.GEMP01007731.1~~GEMP01007731.1.p1  ORF type:complete len:211 (+),score=39.26 GEMP01007731.1:107-739(+)